jgi:hypothetical protein
MNVVHGWRALAAGAVSIAAVAIGLRAVHTEPSASPALPQKLRGLVCAQAFKLAHGYTFAWRADQPEVKCGWLLVLAIDPSLASVRDEVEPVTYVGDQVAERINPGDLSGRRVVIVPSIPDAGGWPVLDPLQQPMWLGEPALPEQLDAAAIHAARVRAESSGVTPFVHSEVAGALDCGNARASFADRSELMQHAANLILQHAPQESAFATGLLAPPVH